VALLQPPPGANDPFGYLSFMVAGDFARGRGVGIVSAQWREVGRRTWRGSQTWKQEAVEISTATPDLTIGPCSVAYEANARRYRLRGRIEDPAGPAGTAIAFDLTLIPDPGLHPPLDPTAENLALGRDPGSARAGRVIEAGKASRREQLHRLPHCN
jgi:hypothetical protein